MGIASTDAESVALTEKSFSVSDYDLAATLSSGQAFRWSCQQGAWSSVVAGRWVQLIQNGDTISALTTARDSNWNWLEDYLQLNVNLPEIIRTFPKDAVLTEAVKSSNGLRLLKQNHWECLASFILSSTKQIVQIQHCVELLCQRFGERVPTPEGVGICHAFPTAQRLTQASEAELRACKLGFRAPYLLKSAQQIAQGNLRLDLLQSGSLEEARLQLMTLPGVGPKIADCVLLFAYGFPRAFPVDVWIYKAIQQLYFPNRRVSNQRIQKFTESYFGSNSGYAQQYIFHYMRTKIRRTQQCK